MRAPVEDAQVDDEQEQHEAGEDRIRPPILTEREEQLHRRYVSVPA
jgi:hypothetical protein